MRPDPRDDSEATQPMAFTRGVQPRAAARTTLGSPIPELSRRVVSSVIAFGVAMLLLALALSALGGRGDAKDRGPVAATTPRAPAGTSPMAPPPGATTPSVIGKNTYEAGGVLMAAGFASPVRWFAEPGAKGAPCTVVRQEPAAGAPYGRGARAVLYVTPGC